MRVPFIAGENPSPLVRVALASDFAYGSLMLIRAKTDPRYVQDANYSMINPDTSLHLHRPTEGEWVGLEPEMQLGPLGAATVSATVWDERGRVGYVTQSILLRTGNTTKGIAWGKLRGERRVRS